MYQAIRKLFFWAMAREVKRLGKLEEQHSVAASRHAVAAFEMRKAAAERDELMRDEQKAAEQVRQQWSDTAKKLHNLKGML